MQNEERIRQRAHEIWEREGRPEGRHEEHWARARRQLEEEDGDRASAAPAAGGAPDDAPTVAAPGGAEATPAQAAAAADAVGKRRRDEFGISEREPGAARRGEGSRA
jgi:Protein of unknown function (DUF2934)